MMNSIISARSDVMAPKRLHPVTPAFASSSILSVGTLALMKRESSFGSIFARSLDCAMGPGKAFKDEEPGKAKAWDVMTMCEVSGRPLHKHTAG